MLHRPRTARSRSCLSVLVVAGVVLLSLPGLLAADTGHASGAGGVSTHAPIVPPPPPSPPREGASADFSQVGPWVAPLSVTSWSGTQIISTTVAYRNTSLALSGGNLIVASGGSLTLDNVTLTISQYNGTGPTPLSHGLLVEGGGQILAKYSSIRSGNGSGRPGFVVLGGASRVFHSALSDLGGANGSPVAGRQGLLVTAAHVDLQDDAFNSVFQVLFNGAGAIGDEVDGSTWVNSTITAGQVGWAEVAGGASWANFSYDSWYGATDGGMLALISGPHTTLANSTFDGDASGTQQYQVYLTYDGFADRGVDASYATVANDRFQTANLGVSDGSHFTIAWDSFNDTGLWTSTGGAAAIIVVTWIGSGVGEQTRDVAIEHDTISNFTHYGIRISQNVSGFNISDNELFDTESTYSTAITEADGIYLIRGVNNGTIWNNVLDMTDRVQATEPTNGIVLEAQVDYVNVSENRISNCSEVGITVQGDSGALSAPSYYLGPSSDDVLYGNRLVNGHSVAAQTMYSTEAIETWMWANGTRVVDNYIAGWTQVNTTQYWNGAGILTSSSEQWFAGNTMVGVRFGFVYETFDSQQELKRLGSFNRSYNVMDDNALSQVAVASVAENAVDVMGPIVNLLTGPVDPSWTFSFSGSNATLRVENATLTSLSASSPLRVANVRFDGPIGIAAVGAAFDFPLAQWTGSAPTVVYGGLQLQIGATAGSYNVTVTNYSAVTPVARWSATQSVSATDAFDLTSAGSGTRYNFSVDGTVKGTLTTAATGLLSTSWAGSGTHAFALAPAGGVGPAPLTISASGRPTLGTAPLKVRFTASASGGTAPETYAWHFGDGTTGSGAGPTHTYTALGTYRAVVTVTDAAGRSANASVLVVVLLRPVAGVYGLGLGAWLLGSDGSSPAAVTPDLSAGPADLPGPREVPTGWWLGGAVAVAVGVFAALRARRGGP